MKDVVCLARGNAKVERSLSENSKVLTSERSLLSDDSITTIRLTKNDIRVTGSGHVHKMPITPSSMQAVQLLFAFRGLWNEWGDSNFQIFFYHRRLESLENLNVLLLYMIFSTTVSFFGH